MSNEPTASASLAANDKFKTPIQIDDHRLILDEPESSGGTNQGPSPVKSVLGSLVSCTAMTIKMYLDHKGWSFQNLKVDIYYSEKRVKKDEQLSEEEQNYVRRGRVRKIDKYISVEGNLSDEQLERIKKISPKCPVHQLLVGSCIINDELHRV